jgi:hypothetical protein
MKLWNYLAWIVLGCVVGNYNAYAVEITPKLDNATCLTCHDGKKGKLEVDAKGGEKRALTAVNPVKFAKRSPSPRRSTKLIRQRRNPTACPAMKRCGKRSRTKS